MRSSFDKWLSQPSTLCLLRRLLSNDDISLAKHTRSISKLGPRAQQSRQHSNHTPDQPSESVTETAFPGFRISKKQDVEEPTSQVIIGQSIGPPVSNIYAPYKRIQSVEQTQSKNGGRIRRTKRTTIAQTGQNPADTTIKITKSMARMGTSLVRQKLSSRKGVDSRLREVEALVTISKSSEVSTQKEGSNKASKKTSKVSPTSKGSSKKASKAIKIETLNPDDFATELFSAPALQTEPFYRPLSSYGDHSYQPLDELEPPKEEEQPPQISDQPYDEATTLQELGLSREGLGLSVDAALDIRRRELYDELAVVPHGLVEKDVAKATVVDSKLPQNTSQHKTLAATVVETASETSHHYSPAATVVETAIETSQKYSPFVVVDETLQLEPSTNNAETKQQFQRLWLLHDFTKRNAVIEQIRSLGERRDEDGIIEVWTKLRDSNYCLPVHKLDAKDAWQLILVVAVNRAFNGNGQFLEDVYSQLKAIRQIHNQSLPRLHKLLIGQFFMLHSLSREKKQPSYASVWHPLLVEDGFASDEMLIYVIDQVMTEKAILEFKKACDKNSSEKLIERFSREAVKIHKYNPELVKLWEQILTPPADTSQDIILSNLSIDSSSRAKLHKQLPFTRTDMNKVVGEVYGVEEKRFSDDFCARIAATTMLSIGMSIKCLQFLGVSQLGPITTQQLISRAGGAEEVKQVLKSLSDAKLLNHNLVYVRLLRKFANEDDRLLRVFLALDQHAQEYEDKWLQRKLMQSHFEKHEWDLAHIAAFAASCKHDFVVDDIWNGLIQAAAKQKNLSDVNRLLNVFQLHRIKLSETTMKCIQTELWQPRAPGKSIERSPQSIGSVIIISNALMQYAGAGGWVDPELWSELLTRLGMTNHTHVLYRLANWIANHYKKGHLIAAKYGKMVEYLDIVFSSNMLKAFVIWFWRAAAFQHQLTESNMPWIADTDCERWALGVYLAKKLSQKDPQHSRYAVRKAIVQQLWTIFGPSKSNKKVNAMVQRRNQLSMKHYISHVESIWPGVLSRSERGITMLEKGGHSNTSLLLGMFGPRNSFPTAGIDADVQEQIDFYWQKSEKIVQIAEEADAEEKEHTDTNKSDYTDMNKTDHTDTGKTYQPTMENDEK